MAARSPSAPRKPCWKRSASVAGMISICGSSGGGAPDTSDASPSGHSRSYVGGSSEDMARGRGCE